jgi:hypothetical protein
MSEAASTIGRMGTVVDLAGWRKARGQPGRRAAPMHPSIPATPDPVDEELLGRLEAAVERLQPLLQGNTGPQRPLPAGVHNEVLAILGELAIGLLGQAASRAERLAEDLAGGPGLGPT